MRPAPARRLLAGFAALALLAAGAPAARADAPRGLTARDLVTLDRVSEVRLAPDGRSAIYVVRRTDWEANRGRTSLWRIDLSARNAEPAPLPAVGDDVGSPRFSADGRWIYFLSGRSGSSQVWRAPAPGGAPEAVTRLPLDVEAYRLSADGRTLVLGLAVFPDCGDLKCTADRLAAPKVPSGRTHDRLFARHWDPGRTGPATTSTPWGSKPPWRARRRSP